MAEKQLSGSIYDQIVKAYEECHSVQLISLALGVSKMTVQRVLITEGLWELGKQTKPRDREAGKAGKDG